MKPQLMQNQILQGRMNQSLLQSIHLLQYNGVELVSYINEIAKENPLIEEINVDSDYERMKQSNQDRPEIGEINKKVDTMYDQLKKQLVAIDYPKQLLPIIEYGIDSLNEDGFLEVDMSQWGQDCHSTLFEVEKALDIIQSLEPAGIGARSLTECILLQLNRMGNNYDFVEELLNEHLDWIAYEELDAMMKKYQISKELAQTIIDQIRLCHPKPGHLLNTNDPVYIIPEASIYKEENVWKIKFYTWSRPIITINPNYKKLKGLEKETDKYLSEKYKQIEWLKQVIDFRTSTLEKVIQIIVEKQYAFFEEGIRSIIPLTLREIASEIDCHISTVSRTINNKYVQTPHGVIPIKFFMQPGLNQNNGVQVASAVIKQHIVQIVEAEDKSKPLSDQLITHKLNQQFGIQIARRTVMKYRKQLQIPSSTKRRRKG